MIEAPPDLDGLSPQLGEQPVRHDAAHAVAAKHRAFDARLYGDHHVGRRIDPAVLGREERPVDATEGVLVAVNQIDLLVLVLEMADAPLAAAIATAGPATELDFVGSGVEAPYAIGKSWGK